jgi:nicotinate-nucleotide--dimethylbenzimidazole phosphoribosyltransferase
MYRIPIVIDGFISATAALIAVRLNPEIRNYIFASHGSAEPGNQVVMKALGMEPMLNLRMRLGEGTGAALGFQIFDAAFAAYYQMGSFDDAKIEQYVPLD